MAITLKVIPKSDYSTYHALVSSFAVARMTATIPHPVALSFIEKRLSDRHAQELADDSIAERGVYVGDELVGGASYFAREGGGKEIGYFIGEGHWGKGYATAAATAIVGLLRRCGYSGPAYASCAQDNPASRRVLEKVGFRCVGEGTGSSAARGSESVPLFLFECD